VDKRVPHHSWGWRIAIAPLAIMAFWLASAETNTPAQKEQLCPLINQVGVVREAASSTFSC
jgi:hypothetical protein